MLKRKSDSSQPDPGAAPEGSAEVTYLEITFAKVPIFSACTPDELMQLAGATTIRAAAPGDTVITEGEPDAREFFVVLRGEAQVTRGRRGQRDVRRDPGGGVGHVHHPGRSLLRTERAVPEPEVERRPGHDNQVGLAQRCRPGPGHQ